MFGDGERHQRAEHGEADRVEMRGGVDRAPASHTVTTVEIVTENGKNMFIGRRVM